MLHNKIKKIAGVKPAFQMHATCSKSQISKNLRDGKVLNDYVRMKGIFSKDTNSVPLINIATGVVAPKNVNVHQAKQIGCSYLATLHGTKPNEIKLSKSSQCTHCPLKLKNVHDVDKASSLDPQLLFQRILALTEVSSDVDLKTCLGFELACYPAALFSEDGYIRDANKSNLAKEILSMTNHPDYVDISSEHHIVKDGGSLLYDVKWERGEAVASIIKKYVSHLDLTHSGKNCHVVFDGYRNSTKDLCHQKRNAVTSSSVDLDETMIIHMDKSDFLSNTENKENFIKMLGCHLEKKGHTVMYAVADSDVDIVKCAINKLDSKDVLVTADDTDILILILL